MTLSEYIRDIGEPAAVRLFGVSIYAVRSWKHGLRSPRPAKANEIVAITNGKVTLSDIYRHRPQPSEAANG